ncbi:MAG: LptF/LptG family permease [Phycisphaerales bacterium]|nr:LptF/LptG family permease [Phycisphaerales bacterium]
MRILDRYIVRSFLVNYLLALAVLVGMYILLDLIVNFDNFTRQPVATDAPPSNAWTVLAGIADYYLYQFLVIFQQVSGAIPLLAAGFTMVRMTRHSELTAMLASGVSLFRVAVPIVLVSVAFSVLNIFNQEVIIPREFVVQKLLRHHGETGPTIRNDRIDFIRDNDNSLLSAMSYDRHRKQMKGVSIEVRDQESRLKRWIMADNAVWGIPPGENIEHWIMHNVMQIDDAVHVDPVKQVAGTVPVMIHQTSITPQQLDLIIQRKAVDYLSSRQVRDLAANPMEMNKAPLYKVMYLRFTQPMMNIIMLLIGIPFLLTREPSRLIQNMMYCVGVTAVVFAVTFLLFSLSGKTISPLLAAWLPVLIFGPISVVMLDSIKT